MFLSSFLQQKRYGYLFISHRNDFWKFPFEWTALAAMLTVSRGVQPCTHADSTLCSMRYWLVPLVTVLFLACSACYWPVPWLFRLLLTCSLLVPLVTGLFRLFRVLETSIRGAAQNARRGGIVQGETVSCKQNPNPLRNENGIVQNFSYRIALPNPI